MKKLDIFSFMKSNNRLLVIISCLIYDVLLYFPDPYNNDLSLDYKEIFIIEHKEVRKKFNHLLIKIEHLLKTNLNMLELKVIMKKWSELNILNSYYIKKFNQKQKRISSDDEISAFICLEHIISDYTYVLQKINTIMANKMKY